VRQSYKTGLLIDIDPVTDNDEPFHFEFLLSRHGSWTESESYTNYPSAGTLRNEIYNFGTLEHWDGEFRVYKNALTDGGFVYEFVLLRSVDISRTGDAEQLVIHGVRIVTDVEEGIVVLKNEEALVGRDLPAEFDIPEGEEDELYGLYTISNRPVQGQFLTRITFLDSFGDE